MWSFKKKADIYSQVQKKSCGWIFFENIICLRAIFSKNQAISEVTVSDFSLFPVYQWWLYKTQKCQIFFLDLQRFSRYWCCKTHFMAPTNLTSKLKKAIFFKIHNGCQHNFLERLGICQGRPGDKYLVPHIFFLPFFRLDEFPAQTSAQWIPACQRTALKKAGKQKIPKK